MCLCWYIYSGKINKVVCIDANSLKENKNFFQLLILLPLAGEIGFFNYQMIYRATFEGESVLTVWMSMSKVLSLK